MCAISENINTREAIQIARQNERVALVHIHALSLV